ncbi:MAG: hypothetical protein GX591_18955, partial [Planctomycetes bacterium]|nr:hypothetical protein [Planctomycetota bacterium]
MSTDRRLPAPAVPLLAAILILAATAAAQPLPPWRVLPIRSQEEARLGRTGGEAEQHPQGIARSASDPDRLYLSHDVGQLWRSDDNGRTWRKTLGAGMFVKCGQSVEADPADADTVLMIVDSAWDWFARDYEGVYRSTDAGETWDLVLKTPAEHQRFHQHCLAYDPASTGPAGASRWYAGFPAGGLFASEDGGRSWTKTADLAAHQRVYGVYAHATDGRTVYLATSEGLLVSTDRGADPRPLGDLPAGEVSGLAFHPTDPGRLYAAVLGVGLFVSADGGTHFEPLRLAADTQGVFAHGGNPKVIYFISRRTGSLVSTDAGRTWRPIHA